MTTKSEAHERVKNDIETFKNEYDGLQRVSSNISVLGDIERLVTIYRDIQHIATAEVTEEDYTEKDYKRVAKELDEKLSLIISAAQKARVAVRDSVHQVELFALCKKFNITD